MRLDSGQMMALAELQRRQAAVQQQVEVCWALFVPANRIGQVTGQNRANLIRQMRRPPAPAPTSAAAAPAEAA